MPIAGLAVTVLPEREPKVCKTLAGVDGIEVHGSDGKGNLVVVVDCDSEEELEKLQQSVLEVDGVITVSAVYYNFEDLVETGGPKAEARNPWVGE